MTEVSLMIGTYNDPEGCYLSLFAALAQLEKSNLEWEVIIVADGGCAEKYENTNPKVRVFRFGGGNRIGSPQGTRSIGIHSCQYKNVLCIDSHVAISSITEWVDEHERIEATTSFPSMVGGSLEMWKLYSSEFDWEGSFWYKNVLYKPKFWEPYRIIETSHSAFMVNKEFFISSGGYTDLQIGYGGEETMWGLRSWMLGGSNWLIPKIWHAHFQPTGRNQDAELTENYKKNFMIAAYVLGGTEYLKKAETHYKGTLKITSEIEKERQRICSGPFNGDLNLLRSYFKTHDIS